MFFVRDFALCFRLPIRSADISPTVAEGGGGGGKKKREELNCRESSTSKKRSEGEKNILVGVCVCVCTFVRSSLFKKIK
jgi:hypothetical protein